jgi:peptide deformylase
MMSSVIVPPVRLVGDPILHAPCAVIVDVQSSDITQARAELHAALSVFRHEHGFGRAISAPQIGHAVRMIALHLADPVGRLTMHNPVLFDLSQDTFTMYDDCMSFPSILVRVRRHKTVSVRFENDSGEVITWENVSQDIAELLQHECDHLDGITAFDRMDGPSAVVHRDVYMSKRDFFDSKVDYAIVPTVATVNQ